VCVVTAAVISDPSPSRSKLTGGQKWMIAGLVVLQIPFSLILYPLAAIFAITGIFVPIAMVLMGIGSLPFSFAMRCKDRWQGGGVAGVPPPVGGTQVPAVSVQADRQVDVAVDRPTHPPREVPDGWIA
jgi:hypothetical protein